MRKGHCLAGYRLKVLLTNYPSNHEFIHVHVGGEAMKERVTTVLSISKFPVGEVHVSTYVFHLAAGGISQ